MRLEPPGGVTKLPGQSLPKLQAGAQQAHFHVRLRKAERVRRFLHRQALDVAQQKDHPMLLVQLVQGFVDAKNANASWVAAFSAIGFWVIDGLVQRPRERFEW